MNEDKTMTFIVRGAGGISLLLAVRGVLEICLYLWRTKDTAADIGAIGRHCLTIGGLVVFGMALWIYGRRLGHWLCRGPASQKKFKPVPRKHDTQV